jgi:hypothetical protein
MKSLKIEILDEKAGRPNGNPFDVKPVSIMGYGTLQSVYHIVDTGIKIGLENDMTLYLTPLIQDVYIFSWTMMDSLKVLVKLMSDNAFSTVYNMEVPFARVSIVEQKVLPVRFVEFAKEGGRKICGEPKEVKDA